MGTLKTLFRQKSATVAWGLDIGSTSIKAVKLAWHKRRGTATLEATAKIDYRKPLSQASNEQEEHGMIGEALTALLGQHPFKTERVCVSVPGRIVMPRVFQLPVADRGKMGAMVQFEAKRQVPARLDQLVWDFQVLTGDAVNGSAAAKAAAKGASVAVLFAAARRKLVQQRFGLLERAGIAVDAAQCECIALYNFFMFQRAAPPRTTAPENGKPAAAADESQARWPVMLLDVGGDGSNLVIGSPAGLWVRHLGFGGYSVTRALVQQFNLTATQAEALKRNPAMAASLTEFYRVWSRSWKISGGRSALRWPPTPRTRIAGPCGNSYASAAAFNSTACWPTCGRSRRDWGPGARGQKLGTSERQLSPSANRLAFPAAKRYTCFPWPLAPGPWPLAPGPWPPKKSSPTTLAAFLFLTIMTELVVSSPPEKPRLALVEGVP